MTNLFKPSWRDLDPAEIKCILHELIGGPGQYEDHANHTSRGFHKFGLVMAILGFPGTWEIWSNGVRHW